MANSQESALHYPLGDTLPGPGQHDRGGRRACAGCAWRLPFALDHINLWLLRDRQDGSRRLDRRRLRHRQRRHPRRLGAGLCHRAAGPAGAARDGTHMHPDHIGLAHWLALTRGTMPAVDQRHRLECRAHGQQPPPASAARRGALLRAHGLTDPESLDKVRARSNYYANMVPQVPDRYRRLMDGMRLPSARATGVHRRLRPCARAHRAALPGAERADLGRHGAAAHFHQRQRDPTSNPRPTRCRCTCTRSSACARCRPTRWCCLRTASPSPACTRASSSCSSTTTSAGRRAGGLRRGADSAADLLPVLFHRQLDLHQTTFAHGRVHRPPARSARSGGWRGQARRRARWRAIG